MPLLGVLALALAAQATPLVWIAPAECPSGDAVRAALAARLGDASVAAELSLIARAFALPDASWRLVLSADGASEPGRVVEGASCAEIADAAVVLAAMALRRAAPAPVEVARGALHVSAAAGVGLGALPEPALVTALEVALDAGPWSAFAGAAVWWPRDGVVGAGAGASLALIAGRAGACVRAEAWSAWLGGCGAVEVGWVGGEGFGTRADDVGGAPWVALAAGPSLRGALGAGWWWTADAQAYVPLVRPRFVLDGVGEVHVPAAVGLRATAGVAVQIP